MDKKRYLNLVIIPALVILAVLLVYRGVTVSPAAQATGSRAYVGIGDLHRLEARSLSPKNPAAAVARPYVGIGDVRILDARSLLSNKTAAAISRPLLGMGDLRLKESRAAGGSLASRGIGDLRLVESQASRSGSVGIGDLRLYEALH